MNPLTGPHKTKAKKFKLTEVTRRTIAYASVQVGDFHVFFVECLLLKSQDLHCTFLYESVGLVRQCIQPGGILRLNHTFETDPEDPWVIDTLKWWNE
jgi:hypothetical protein